MNLQYLYLFIIYLLIFIIFYNIYNFYKDKKEIIITKNDILSLIESSNEIIFTTTRFIIKDYIFDYYYDNIYKIRNINTQEYLELNNEFLYQKCIEKYNKLYNK